MTRRAVALAAMAVLLLVPLLAAAAPVAPSAHYLPRAGDAFLYDETISVGSGTGDYTGYTEQTVINGTVKVTAIAANGTDSALYYNADSYSNNTGASYRFTSSGTFTFSATSFHYVAGTDNQTGYTNPLVWFYMDNTLTAGTTFYLLNSEMSVVQANTTYDLGTAAGSYVRAIFAEGNGSYQRNDGYGIFTATYNWKAYFDPSTGYVIGYQYTEQDTNSSGDGFTYTDVLGVTQTTYPLTQSSPPPATSSSASGSTLAGALLGVLLVVIVILILVALVLRSRRHRTLPEHSSRGQVSFGTPGGLPPPGAPPPPVSLSPSGQPMVQQVVIKETVKVKCQYCGSLIDSTVKNCPFCGAART